MDCHDYCHTYLRPEIWELRSLVKIVEYIQENVWWSPLEMSIKLLQKLIKILIEEQRHLTSATADFFMLNIRLPYLRPEL